MQSGPSSPDVPEEFVLRHVMSLNPKTGSVEIMTGVNRETIRRSDSSFRYSEDSTSEHLNMDGKRYGSVPFWACQSGLTAW